MWRFSMVGLLLVVLGVGIFMRQMHLLPATMTVAGLWPILLVLLGFSGLKEFRRRRIPWWSLFFIVLGILLVLKNIGLVPMLSSLGGWTITLALALIFAGLSMITPRRFGRPVSFQFGDTHKIPKSPVVWNDGEIIVEDLKTAAKEWTKHKTHSSRRVIGDMSIGSHPWVLKEDMSFWNAIGDLRINLATAHIEDGTYHLDIGGMIGDVRVLVPETLPVLVEARLKVGDVNLFGQRQSGLGREIHHQDVGFDTATKRLVIHVELLVGDVQIVRV